MSAATEAFDSSSVIPREALIWPTAAIAATTAAATLTQSRTVLHSGAVNPEERSFRKRCCPFVFVAATGHGRSTPRRVEWPRVVPAPRRRAAWWSSTAAT
jgi:hypothetical protein